MSTAPSKLVMPSTEQPSDTAFARLAPRTARRLAATLLLLLAGCGGGSDSAPEMSDGVTTDRVTADRRTATVFPARAGLVLAEHSAQGDVLQQSTATDDSGLASFDAEIAGSRLLGTTTDTGWRVPLRRSARLLGDGQTLELTPLTTIFDQFVGTGLPETEARTRVYDLLASACAVTSQVLPDTAMYGDHPLDGSAREWLLAALDAYVDALGRLGLSSDTTGIDWPRLLGKHAALLEQLCDTARAVHSDGWRASATDTLANRHGLAAGDASRVLKLLRPQALALVLDRVADRIAWLEHPSLGATLEARTPEWIGNPPDQVTQLIDAALTRTATSGGTDAASMAGIALDRQGRIVQTVSGQTTWAEVDSPPLRFVNRAVETRSVSLTINGIALDSLADLIVETLALPAEQAGEPLQRRAWRYVARRTIHSWPVTGGNFQHQAELYLRSAGYGLCDDVAHALALLWRAMGYNARIIWLEGHVVPEVSVDGRWELYDPDYRVYYLNRKGLVASVADLENDATLILSPVQQIANAVDGSYGSSLVQIYTSADDNVVDASLQSVSISPFDPTLDLPADASLEIQGESAVAVPTIEPGPPIEAAALKLRLPPGFAGTVRLPYILTDIAGDGRVAWLGQSTHVPLGGLAASILGYYKEAPRVGIASVLVEQVGPQGLTLTMMVNPSLAPFGAALSARLTGSNVSGIEVSATPP